MIADWENDLPIPYKDNIPKQCLVYHIAGYIVKKLNKQSSCVKCAQTLLSEMPSDAISATFTAIKDFGSNNGLSYLTYPSESVFNILLQVETVLEKKLSSVSNLWGDIFYECLDYTDEIVLGTSDLVILCGKQT